VRIPHDLPPHATTALGHDDNTGSIFVAHSHHQLSATVGDTGRAGGRIAIRRRSEHRAGDR